MSNSQRLLGRVVNELGKPVAGAKVVALSNECFQRHPIEAELWEGKGLYDDTHVEETDSEGRFSFSGGLRAGKNLSVSILAHGYAPLRLTHERLSREWPHDIGDLVLKKGHSVSGTVVDDLGAPLADVQVLMALERGVPGNYQCFPGRGMPLTRTDEAGRFTAVGLLPGRWFLLFDKQDYRVAEKQGNFFNEPNPEEIHITLGRGDTISGRVLDVPDEAVGKLMVEARPIKGKVDYVKQFPSRARPRRGVVQVDGSFRIEGLHAEPFKPNIQPLVQQGYHSEITTKAGEPEFWLVVGFAADCNQPLFELPVVQSCRTEAGDMGVELPWLGRANFSARMVNEQGEPVEIDSVEVRYETGFGPDQDTQRAMILSGGRIELRDYKAWDFHLQYWQPRRRVSLWIRAVGYKFKEIEIQDHLVRGQSTDIGDVVLESTPRVPVRIVDEAGSPVAGAEVRLSEHKNDLRRNGWRIHWAYEFSVPKPGTWFGNVPYHRLITNTNDLGEAVRSEVVVDGEMLSVAHPDYAFTVLSVPVESEKKKYPIEIRLAPAGKIRVHVMTEEGEPAAWRPVFVEAMDPKDIAKPAELRGYRFEGETDEFGMVTFDRLNGRFLVGLKHPEEIPASEHEQKVVEVDGDDVEVKLLAWPVYDFLITVRESDRPVVGGTLHMLSEDLCKQDASYGKTPWKGYTGDRGEFRFRDIPPGDYVLQVKHDDRNMVSRRTIRVGPDMEPIDWVLDNNTITGKLVDPDGNPIAHKRIGIKTEVAGYCQGNSAGISYLDGCGGIEWFWSGPWLHESWTDADGKFHLRGLAADLPIHLYTNHGDLKEVKLEIQPLQHGEHRQGVIFLAEMSD